MGILDGKRLLITGVLTDASLAFAVAKLAQEEGAEIVLTGAGRGMRLTERTARKLPEEAEVLEFDVTSAEQAAAVRSHLAAKWGQVDGALHAIGFAPEVCLGEDFMAAQWADVSVAVEISAYSLKTVAEVVAPLMTGGGSIVGLDFDARFAWPAYNWMGVAKAALARRRRHPGQPRCCRADPDLGRQEHSGFRSLRGRLGHPGTAGLGCQRRRARGKGLRGAHVRLVPGDDRRDDPRRRRLPRHRSLRATRGGTD